MLPLWYYINSAERFVCAMTLNQKEKQRFLDVLGGSSGSGVHSHAYIIEGAFGVGKSEFALFCTAAILCEGNNPPCGSCKACKKVFSGSHPDVHFYGGEGGKPVTMKEVRELIASSVLLPNDSDKKAYIIKDAHKMRTDTQNAMLKLFEEPPQSVVVFMLAEKKEALLPTILSRGQLITLYGADDETVEAYLREKHKNTADQDIRSAVRAAEGSVGRAELLLKKDSLESKKKASGLLELLFSGGRLDFYDRMLSARITREKLSDLLELLQRFIADIIQFKYKSADPVFLSEEEASRYAERVSKKALLGMNNAIMDCRRTIESSGNLNAAITNLSIKLWTLKG